MLLSFFISLFLTRIDKDSLSISPLFLRSNFCVFPFQAGFFFFFPLACFSLVPFSFFLSFAPSWDCYSFLSHPPFHPIVTLTTPCSHFLPHPVITVHQWEVVDVHWNQWPFKCRSQSLSHSFSFFVCQSCWYCLGQSLSLWFLSLFSNVVFLLLFSTICPISPLVLCSLSLSLFPLHLHVSLTRSSPFPLCERLSLSVGCISSPLWRNESFWSSTRGEAPSALIHFLLVTGAYSTAYYSVPRCFMNFTRELNISTQVCPAQSHSKAQFMNNHVGWQVLKPYIP